MKSGRKKLKMRRGRIGELMEKGVKGCRIGNEREGRRSGKRGKRGGKRGEKGKK
jgi:hypothetical protein